MSVYSTATALTTAVLILLSSNNAFFGCGIASVTASAGLHAGDTVVTVEGYAAKDTSFCSDNGWEQVWADEFDGSTLDETKWQATLGVNGGKEKDTGFFTFLITRGFENEEKNILIFVIPNLYCTFTLRFFFSPLVSCTSLSLTEYTSTTIRRTIT